MHATAPGLPDPASHPEVYDDVPGKRVLAWLVDAALIGAANVVLLPLLIPTAFLLSPLVFLAVGFAYRTATLARGSATWGMRLMALGIRDAEGRPLDHGTAAAHTALYYVALVLLPLQILSAGLMAASPRRQGLGDLLLGTAAVNHAER